MSVSIQGRGLPAKIAIAFAALATVMYLTTATFELYKTQVESRNAEYTTRQNEYRATQYREMEEKNKQLEGEIERLRVELADKGRNTSPQSEAATETFLVKQTITNVQSQVTDLRTSLNNIANVVQPSPEKTLVLPLLRKDLDDFKGQSERDIDELRAEMARNYDLNKWLIGLILAAVLGTAINSFIQSKRPNKESAASE